MSAGDIARAVRNLENAAVSIADSYFDWSEGSGLLQSSWLTGAAKETRAMNEQGFPNGWNEQRVKELIAELDARTDEEWIAADEAAADDGGDQAVITVPASLLPDIRRLLASHITG
jgi:hypothetical protein